MKKFAESLAMNSLSVTFAFPVNIVLCTGVLLLVPNLLFQRFDDVWILGLMTIAALGFAVVIGLGMTVFEHIEAAREAARNVKRSAKHRDLFLKAFINYEETYDFFTAQLALDREGFIAQKELTQAQLDFLGDTKNLADAALREIMRPQAVSTQKKRLAPQGLRELVEYRIPASLEYINK